MWFVEIFSRTCFEAATAKEMPRTPSIFVRTLEETRRPGCPHCGLRTADCGFMDGVTDDSIRSIRNKSAILNPQSAISNPSCPGADGSVASSIGVQDRERVGGARLAPNRDEHSAATDQRLENASVMRLEPDAPHRAGDANLREIAGTALQRVDQRPARDHGTNVGRVEPLHGGSERLLDQFPDLGALLRQDRQRLGWKSRLLQRVEALLRPRDVLKHRDGEESGLDVDHGRVM